MDQSKIKRINLAEAFDIEKSYLILGGFYPIKDVSKRSRMYYYIRGTFFFTYSWLEWILILVYLYTKLSDVVKLSDTLLFCMTQSAFMCKLVNFIIMKKYLLVIEKGLENPLLASVDEVEEKLIADYVNGIKILAKIFRFFIFLAVVFFGLYPILDHKPGEIKDLPLPIWVPIDTEKYYVYTWFLVLSGLSIGAWTNSNIDILNIMLITLATALTEILKRRLKNSITTAVDVKEEIEEMSSKQKIRACIHYYNAIISLVNDIENVFSRGIFVQFLCSVLVICSTGFQMVVSDYRSIHFILLISYFNVVTCQIAMYCWFGHLLMYSSNEITDACYSAEWFKCDVSIQRMFITIMERAKRPLTVQAANFFTLNLTTLLAILRSSYSYFAVLQHMYSNRSH